MKVIRNFKTQIDIIDMHKLFSGDTKEIALSILKQQYAGRCRFGCLILEILEITQMSIPRIDPAAGTGQAYSNIAFTAEVLEYTVGECIIMKIAEIYPEGRILTHNDEENTVAVLKRDSAPKNYKN